MSKLTAFDQAKKWGIVPEYRPGLDRDKTQEEYRQKLEAMREVYVEKAEQMRPPPSPGRPPKQYAGAPPFPEAYPMPPEPPRPLPPRGLPTYPSPDQLYEYVRTGSELQQKEAKRAVEEWETAMAVYEKALAEYRPRFQAAKAEEDKILAAYRVENEKWLDTVYWPGEAERIIWEAAREVEEEEKRRIRAEADLAEQEMTIRRAKAERRRESVEGWAPVIMKIGIGLGGLGAAAYVIWRIFG